MNFQKKQIPNILTILRILILPILIGIFIAIACDCDTIPIYSINAPKNVVWQHNLLFLISGILFTIASFTDLLDGYLARKYKWVSDFGKLWDPIADKILVNTTLIFFAVWQLTPWWIVVVMIVRDTIVDASRMYAASKKIVVAADIYGKLKTITQMVGIILIFFIFNFRAPINKPIIIYYFPQNIFMIIALLFSIISGVNYLVKIIKLTKHK